MRDLVKVNNTEQDLASHVYLINNKQDCLRKLQLILGQRILFGVLCTLENCMIQSH